MTEENDLAVPAEIGIDSEATAAAARTYANARNVVPATKALRATCTEAYGRNVTGPVTGQKSAVYAVVLDALEGPEPDAERVASLAANHSKGDLRDAVETALIAAGFEGEDGALAIPGREDDYNEIPGSIGPIVGLYTAVVARRFGIDVSDAEDRHA